MGSVFRESVTVLHLTASFLLLRSPCWGDVKDKPASVCLEEIDGILDDSQTEPGLIHCPCCRLPTVRSRQGGVICQGVGITCISSSVLESVQCHLYCGQCNRIFFVPPLF